MVGRGRSVAVCEQPLARLWSGREGRWPESVRAAAEAGPGAGGAETAGAMWRSAAGAWPEAGGAIVSWTSNDFWMARPLPSSVKTLFNAATQRPDFSLKKALVTLAAAAVSVAVCGLARRSCSVAQR